MMLSTVAGEQLGRRAPPRLLLEIDVGERLPVVIADDEAGLLLLEDQGGGKRATLSLLSRLPQASPEQPQPCKPS